MAPPRPRTAVPAQRFYPEPITEIIDEVDAVAGERGVPAAQVALAWLLRRPAVAAPVAGATKASRLTEAIGATGRTLTEEEAGRLEAHYRPQAVSGHSWRAMPQAERAARSKAVATSSA